MSLSKVLSKTLFWLVVVHAAHGFGREATPPLSPQAAAVLSPVPRLPTDADKIIRDFVHLLYPDWDTGAWDLVIAGRRSMNPNFGVDGWSFAVIEAAEPVVQGFYPSATACHDHGKCFTMPDVANAELLGRVYQRGTRMLSYEGSRPNTARKNANLQQTLHSDSSLQDVQNQLAAANAHYPPSSESGVRKHLETETLFVKYGFHIRSLKFCRSIGPLDRKQVAMFWSARVFSARFQQLYLLTIEPFDGDVTGLLVVGKGDEPELSCTP
jgi:hypothetical protein